MDGNCKDCVFWDGVYAPDPKTGERDGHCHAHPPVPQIAVTTKAVFPRVSENAWCGEFQPEPKEEPAPC